MKNLKSIISFFILLAPIFARCQIDSGYVEVDRGKIFYKIWGQGDPIVFINGGPGYSSAGYHAYADSLSKFGRIILFDQRGTGKSISSKGSAYGTFSIWGLVKDLDALRIHLGYKKWSVIGHSFGGQYALYYVSKYSDVVNKLVLSASPEYGELHRFTMQRFRDPPLKSLTQSELELYNRLLTERNKSKVNYIEVSRLRLALKARYYVQNPANYRAVANWFIQYKPPERHQIIGKLNDKRYLRKSLLKINTPTLIIHGMADFLNFENSKENHSVLKNSTIELIEESGHMILLDQPQKYLSKIGVFIKN